MPADRCQSTDMPHVLIVNGHQPFPTSPGGLNAAFVQRARDFFTASGWTVRLRSVADGWDTEEEVHNQVWADVILFQFPLNSMGLPWSLKRYLDEVYTAGMDGRLSKGDGRSRKDATRQYGSGGRMTGTRYMLSLTLNAPRSAFDDPAQTFFEGRSVEDLLWPVHLNFRFFGMQPMPSFAAHDVSKAPDIDRDFQRFDAHLAHAFRADGSA